MVLQPARQVEEGGEAEEPEATREQQRGAEQRDGQRVHAGVSRDPWARTNPGPRLSAAFQHGLQLNVSLHTAAKLHGRRLQVIIQTVILPASTILHYPRSHYSSMNSLSSMSTSCLQNRDASSYYSMFHHDPLSSLSSYGRSCGVASAQSASAINSHMGTYGSSLTSSSSSSTSGSGSSALLGSGMSMPLQVPGQSSDIASNYWPRLQ